jgi:aerobic C4-dicarboxylate transport protein
VVVSRWEGALDKEQFDAALAGKLPPVEELPEGVVAA